MPIGPARMPLFDHIGELRRRLTIIVVSLLVCAIVVYFATPALIELMMDQIREAMRAYAAEKGADGIVLCITDIMEEGSQVLLEGETEAAQKGLGIADEHDGVWMPGVLSRKKQVAAPIMAAC